MNHKTESDYVTFDGKKSSFYDTQKIFAFEQSLNRMKFQLQFFDQTPQQENKCVSEDEMLIQQEMTMKTQNNSDTQTQSQQSETEDKVSRKYKRRQQLLDHIFKDTSNVTRHDDTDYSILDSLDNTNEIQKQLRDINQFQLKTKVGMSSRNNESNKFIRH